MNWPDDLIEDLARRQCVIYLGSGVSHNSQNERGDRPETWLAFFYNILKEVDFSAEIITQIRNNLDKDNYLIACDIVKKSLGRDRFNDLLLKHFVTPKFKAAPIHEYIFKLDTKIVATPNFDTIYETYAGISSQGTIIVKNYYDSDIVSTLRRNSRVVLKLHGTTSFPDKLIFSQSDYAKARIKENLFYLILDALLITQTFLFLGAGLNDPDIKLLLENYKFRYDLGRTHYFALPTDSLSQLEQEIYADTMNLTFLTYSKENVTI